MELQLALHVLQKKTKKSINVAVRQFYVEALEVYLSFPTAKRPSWVMQLYRLGFALAPYVLLGFLYSFGSFRFLYISSKKFYFMMLSRHVIARMCSLLQTLSDNICCTQIALVQSQVYNSRNNHMHISVGLREDGESARHLQDISLSAFLSLSTHRAWARLGQWR